MEDEQIVADLDILPVSERHASSDPMAVNHGAAVALQVLDLKALVVLDDPCVPP